MPHEVEIRLVHSTERSPESVIRLQAAIAHDGESPIWCRSQLGMNPLDVVAKRADYIQVSSDELVPTDANGIEGLARLWPERSDGS